MTLGSLFDGIGGWLLAARHAGVTPVWASEIEPFPCSVTARHFPDVKQLGDITQINPDEIEPVDIICAGSPCQDLSIAGKRKGLNGERSGLFHTAVELVRRMRLRTGGRCPRFFVWENVPGAFSSNKGMDFRAVLEEIGQTEIPIPPNGRWANAGLAELPQCQIAWRVLDAQYWGVPQRRRRIFLVTDFAADDRRAGEILFEPEGVCGDPETGEGAGKETAGGTADCARIAVYDIQHRDDVIRPVKDGKMPTLTARMGTGGHNVPIVLTGGRVRRLTPTELDEYLQEVDVYGAKEGIKALFVLRKNHGTEKTLEWCFAIVERIQQAEILQQGLHEKSVSAKTTHGKKLDDDTLPCEEYIAEWLLRDMWQQSNDRCSPQRWESAEQFVRKLNESVQKLSHENTPSQKEMCDMWKAAEGTRLLRETFTAVQEIWESVYCKKEWARRSVRRLTPLEAERLQGLPDGYTDSGSDTARYKALGNGMAQPCADYVIRRIVECVKEAQ